MRSQLWIIIANGRSKRIVVLVIGFFDEKKLSVFNPSELQRWYKIPEVALLFCFKHCIFLTLTMNIERLSLADLYKAQ